ncbi:MAG TPA: amidohydrolase [Steroidobacteraceae bacterium]|nr:amidohydrolase [Steroidobacteraceae bacterium]
MVAIGLAFGLPAGSVLAAEPDDDVRAIVDRELDGLVHYYEALHATPELSRMEEHTSADLARELRAAGYTVTDHVGRYALPGYQGYGVVALLRNGAGPTLLVRTDMDALPVAEKTGLAYASTRRVKTPGGAELPVMHACGHDIHVTSMVGFARVMAALKSRWHGTLMLVGQPAEETIDGAEAMLRDGLYERFPKPDLALALHDSGQLPIGSVGLTPGFALATSTQMDVVVRGVGGHGSAPQDAKDPIVLAANIVMQLQTIVSREISPFDQAVVTVGTIHGGTKRNIIPDEVKLELNIRTYKDEVREHIIQAVARIVRAAALGAGMPEDRLPLVSVLEHEYAPALYNDPALAERLRPVLRRALGNDNVRDAPPIMASEDFGRFGLNRKIPVLMFWVGANSPETLAAAEKSGTPVPTPHSPLFAPVARPTLRTGIIAMSAAALEVLGR